MTRPRWYREEGASVLRQGPDVLATVRPLGTVWEVAVRHREVCRAADEQAGRVVAEGMLWPPRDVERHR